MTLPRESCDSVEELQEKLVKAQLHVVRTAGLSLSRSDCACGQAAEEGAAGCLVTMFFSVVLVLVRLGSFWTGRTQVEP